MVRARDRVMLALAGALPGLQQIDAESTLTEQEQQAIAAAHREAALAALLDAVMEFLNFVGRFPVCREPPPFLCVLSTAPNRTIGPRGDPA